MPTPNRRISRRIRRTLTPAAAVTSACTALVAATTSSPVYSGTGWKAETAHGVYSLHPGPYTVVFADSRARTKLAPYLKTPAGQVTLSVGVPVTVTTLLDSTPRSACPGQRRIVVHYVYRPTGKAGISKALPCHNLADGSASGGHILMDSEYWTSTSWFSTNTTLNDAYRKNAVTHELGHILGLDHPNTDRDKDGTVEAYECVKNTAGWMPVMCSPNGGYRTATGAGKFTTEFDLPGLRQMLRNYYLRQS
ncbi:hypothetical protein PV402_39580 [Streptomyces scabiei]|uniref:hypothetical protein n=1 Tax=Streptomyces scabiei TaxID=1930 RepID=UPI0029BB1E6B|nr:hypothetical protein [Streptomyces scabiei]MDX2658290.1 hypothetical protein [Streptomyces scabiei]MDX2870575.1 hypothetical protein [Streptomyces scabiei]